MHELLLYILISVGITRFPKVARIKAYVALSITGERSVCIEWS